MNIIGARILLTQKYNEQSRCEFYKDIKIIPHLCNAQPGMNLCSRKNNHHKSKKKPFLAGISVR
jgi:hypothetical protein